MSKVGDIVADARRKIWIELWKAYGEMYHDKIFVSYPPVGYTGQSQKQAQVDRINSEIDRRMADLCPACYRGIYYTDFLEDGTIRVTNKWTEPFSAAVHVVSIRITAETVEEEEEEE